MEIAIPRIVVRFFGPGIGVDVVSALSAHPVEVTEARDLDEVHRVASERPVLLAVVIDPQDTCAAVAEMRADFPETPLLIVSSSTAPNASSMTGTVDVISGEQSLQNICWHVMEAISRATCLSDATEHALGPVLIEIDEKGLVAAKTPPRTRPLIDGRRIAAGDSFLSFLEPQDRDMVARIIERAAFGEAFFCVARFVNRHGGLHTVSLGAKSVGAGRIAVLVQPLIFGGPVVARYVNDRDPTTGLFTRWALPRVIEAQERDVVAGGYQTLVLVKLEQFQAIGDYIRHPGTNLVLVNVTSALNAIFPYPAIISRLTGDTFLAFVPDAESDHCLRRAERLIQVINAISVPNLSPGFTLRASVGLADAVRTDTDLAIRIAEAAAFEAFANGGNRCVIGGVAEFTREQAGELNSCMSRGAWEMWLQPVVGCGGDQVAFYETLARFDMGKRRMASRADFFVAGQAQGLLERFDRMMLHRAIEMLDAHPDLKLSVNVTYETFMANSFPAAHLDIMQTRTGVCERIVLEIAPRCMAAPMEMASKRLRDLADAGVAVALDDFGSGICRLRYLTQLPLAFVKLDECVTGYVDDDPLQREFVRTVANLCRTRGIRTVAEYTRTPEQMARLVTDGVDLFQGELFGMPRPATEGLAPPVPAAV